MNDMDTTKTTERGDAAPVVFVIVGATGDLSRAKLLPAIGALAAGGELARGFRVVGTTRRANVSAADLLAGTPDADALAGRIEMFAGSFDTAEDARKLESRLGDIDAEFGESAIRIFHLSVPPRALQPIIASFADAGCLAHEGTRLLLEKPFGTDLASARELDAFLAARIPESRTYRVDHYLEKRMARVLAESANLLPELSSGAVERIDIIASESADAGRRAEFYDGVGALRDVLQNHLLELAAVLLAGAGKGGTTEGRLAALTGCTADPARAKRAQYEGYADALGYDSNAETFAAIEISSTDPRIAGVPILLATGKGLAEKRTEIRITYRGVRTTISFDPNFIERMRQDGTVDYAALTKLARFDGYAAAYQDAVRGTKEFFVGRDEALEAWRVVEPIMQAWRSAAGMKHYAQGTRIEDLIGNSSKL